MKRLICLLLLPLALAACATRGVDDATKAEANRPLTCRDKAQCDLYWSRAQVWVTQNGVYRIQTMSDNVISTYGPFGNKGDLAYQVVKEVNNDGSARITIKLSCDNPLGCRPHPAEGAIQFKRYVVNGRQ